MDGTCVSLQCCAFPGRQGGAAQVTCPVCHLHPVLCRQPPRGSISTLKPRPPFRLTQIWFWGDGQAGGKAPVLQSQGPLGSPHSVGPLSEWESGLRLCPTCWPSPPFLL